MYKTYSQINECSLKVREWIQIKIIQDHMNNKN